MVGKRVPKAGDVQNFISTIGQIHEDLKPSTVQLTSEQRRRTLKMRTGGDEIVRIILNQAEKAGLKIAAASIEDVRRDMTLIARLKPLEEALDELRERVHDTILEAQSEAWTAATTYYSSLTRMARGDGTLERALEPAAEFFAIGPRRAKNNAENTAPPSPAS
jgi:hypothetical protein